MLRKIFILIKCIIVVHVNSFILVMGYYQYKTKFKLSKVFKINNTAWFYSTILAIFLTILGVVEINKIQFYICLSPIIIEGYWFIKVYLYLYCLSPFLNLLIENLSLRMHRLILLVCLLLFSIIPTITNQQTFYNGYGKSLSMFIYLYLIGAYFGKYPIDKHKFMKKLSTKYQRIFLLCIYIVTFTISFLIYNLGVSLLDKNTIIKYIGKTLKASAFASDSPFVLLGSICYFLSFYYMKIQSKTINFISSTVIGIYLIHEFRYIRKPLYTMLGFIPNHMIVSYTWLLKLLLGAVVIFIICGIIELLRQQLFKIIYDLKISKKIRDLFNNYILNKKQILILSRR